MTNLNELIKKAPDSVLRKFARQCALRHVEKVKPYCSDEDYEAITNWLNTGDESIRSAAYSAVYSAARSANSAAYSARSARSAAYSAYSAANSTAESAADWAAESAADSAADSAGHSDAWDAWDAEREWQEQTLREMMEV